MDRDRRSFGAARGNLVQQQMERRLAEENRLPDWLREEYGDPRDSAFAEAQRGDMTRRMMQTQDSAEDEIVYSIEDAQQEAERARMKMQGSHNG
jgi:hypothetical protein